MKRARWTQVQVERLRADYPDNTAASIAVALERPIHCIYAKAADLGLKKSAAFLASERSGRLRRESTVGLSGRFMPGNRPWNKGAHYVAGGRSHETRFKHGQVSARWDPEIYGVGALRINADGGLDIKIAPGARQWRALHRLVWEEHFGAIPPGTAVRARDGDLHNCIDVSNLYLVTRADLMRANTIHNLPPKLKSAIQLVGQLKRRIRERQDNRRPA